MANTFSLKVIACDRVFLRWQMYTGDSAAAGWRERQSRRIMKIWCLPWKSEKSVSQDEERKRGLPAWSRSRFCTDHQQPCHGTGGYLRSTRRRLMSAVRKKQKSVPKSSSDRSRVFRNTTVPRHPSQELWSV